MTDRSWEFTQAVTRRPGPEAATGLRAVDTGNPDPERMRAQHAIYVATLREAGVTVTELPPLKGFADAQFVEDTALSLPEGVIMMRPGAPSRLGEVGSMVPALAPLFKEVRQITGPGHVEAGDILFTGREILVGLSARTDAAGVAELEQIVAGWGHRLRVVQTPPGVLHFKTDCSLLGTGTILSTSRLAASGCFTGYDVVVVPEGEEAAANLIRVNALILMAGGFPRTTALLRGLGYGVREVPNSECALIDGGMSCLSLRF
ncbi:MAG: arginine deiminase family protein [Rhodobacterales bacterium]|nr:arginine deiminase family protein [Rhodobacterales bacterium]